MDRTILEINLKHKMLNCMIFVQKILINEVHRQCAKGATATAPMHPEKISIVVAL